MLFNQFKLNLHKVLIYAVSRDVFKVIIYVVKTENFERDIKRID